MSAAFSSYVHGHGPWPMGPCAASITNHVALMRGLPRPGFADGPRIDLVCGMLSRSASSDAKSTDSISFVSSASFSEGLGDGGGEAISSGEFEPLRESACCCRRVRSGDFATLYN